ncbi:hypothetical protein B0J17DRAFT_625729 [Rhizoctonia solani]|nr:hypothetical protein B0J17DRAFT_625729 [Rhizoctonia solani]
MASTLVTYPMSLVAVLILATMTLFIAITQGQQLLDIIASALSIAFWELIVAPLIVLATLPFILLIVIPTCIVILAALALTVALGLIVVIIERVARLRSQLASIKTSIHASKSAARTTLETKPQPNRHVSVTPISVSFKEPRRFKKRRPINYSGAKPTLPLDPRNDAHTRFTAHIARIRSKAWHLETLKESASPVQEGTPTSVATIATPPTPDERVVTSVETPSAVLICPTPPEITNPPTERRNVESSALTKALEEPKPIADTTSSLSRLQASIDEVQKESESAELEYPLSPPNSEHPVAAVESSTPAPNITTGPYASPIESPVPNSPLLSTNDPSSSLPSHPIAEPAGHAIVEQAVDQNTMETITSTITDSSFMSIMEQHLSNIRASSPTSQDGGETNLFNLTFNETSLSSTILFTVTEPDATQFDPSALIHNIPNQPMPNMAISDEILQTEMDIVATPTYHDMLTEMELFDGFVDAPPTFGMSAPSTVDQGSQPGYMHNTSGAATFTSGSILALVPNSVDNYGMFGSDIGQVDTSIPLPSDEELLELAAAALATEGMDWVEDTLHSGTSALHNANLPALPLTDQQLLELDSTLLLDGASLAPPAPHTSNRPETTNAYINPNVSTPLTNDELLVLAGPTIDDGAAWMVTNSDSSIGFDFDLNTTDTDLSFLDSSLLEPLDQATQSTGTDLTHRVLGPSGLPGSYDPTTLGLADPFNPGLQHDPNELARMWDEFGASLQGWVGQIPGAMNFSEEDIMQMLIEFDALETTCSPSHMTLNQISTYTTTPSNPAPSAHPPRRIKGLPLRRTLKPTPGR